MKSLAVLVLVTVSVAVAGVTQAATPGSLVGKPAPEITAQYWLNSPALSLKALRGKIAVVEFWATWCPPCRKSIPHLIELNKKYSAQGVVIIGLTDEPKTKVEPFVEQMGMNYALGGGSQSSGPYGVTGIPTAFIVDVAGQVAWSGHPMEDAFVPAIEEQLKKSPPKAGPAKKSGAFEDITAAMQKGRFGRAAALLAEFEVPERDTAAKNQVERVRKALLAQAPARLAQGERSFAAKDYYKASEAFQDVTLMAPGSPSAKKAEERLRTLEADEKTKAEVDQGREKAAEEALREVVDREKIGPAARAKALEDLAERFPNTKAGAMAAEKAKALGAKAE